MYCLRGKVCSFNTFMFMAGCAGFLYCGTYMSQTISREALRINSEMTQECNGKEHGILRDFDLIYS